MTTNAALAWNDEYQQQGIPSSHREEPSGVLLWALSNLHFIDGQAPKRVVDLGCGTGRNSVALAAQGYTVDGIDFSQTALEVARRRSGADAVTFSYGDLSHPLPYETASFDFAADIFVYFHQLSDDVRRSYRHEIHRTLRPGAYLLVSLATSGDGYYGSCPPMPDASDASTLRLTWDPHAKVGNILPSVEEFIAEFSDLFELQMLWSKRKIGTMHGAEYVRETVATLWIRK